MWERNNFHTSTPLFLLEKLPASHVYELGPFFPRKDGGGDGQRWLYGVIDPAKLSDSPLA
jgi:hypothetical protein